MIGPVEERIDAQLSAIERSDEVRVLLPVESGSRAWGFASTDSDYDVRFIYIHRPEWYLSIEAGRDVIERPLTDEIDLSGWDIRKAEPRLRHAGTKSVRPTGCR